MTHNRSYRQEGLPKALALIDMILAEDLQSLMREKIESKIAWWHELSTFWDEFRREWPPDWGETLRNTIRSRFKLAQLLLASSFSDDDGIPVEIKDVFSSTELTLLQDFELYKSLDVLSVEDIVDRSHRREGGLFELVKEFYLKQYADLDAILDNPEIQRDLMTAFRDRYQERQLKIKEAVKAYSERFGPADLVGAAEHPKSSDAERPSTVYNVQGDLFQGPVERGGGDAPSFTINRGAQPPPVEASPLGSFCSSCGKSLEVPQGTQYCPHCGHIIANEA